MHPVRETVQPESSPGPEVNVSQGPMFNASASVYSEICRRSTLRHSDGMEELERSILESGPMSIIATDPMGVIVAMNSAAERLTFYRRRELIGEHSLILLHDPAEVSSHATRLNDTLAEPVSAGMPSLTEKARQGSPEEREWTYIRKDGTRVSVNATITALFSAEGRLTGYMAVAFDITEHKKFFDSVQRMEMHDQLTGLPNRTLMLERIGHGIRRATRFGQRLAIFLINLDHFERFNASLGISGGDAVLQHVATQLQGAVRKTDTVARIGGDEFVVVMPDFRSSNDAERCAELLQHKLSTAIQMGDREVKATASVGICMYPEGGKDIHELLSNAHSAMRLTKLAGRAGHQLYTHNSRTLSIERLEMEEDLRHALERNELFLEYQPQVECSNGEVTGFESLLRWRSEKRGIVPPGEFIPMAEDLGIMRPISRWVFERACADCVELQRHAGKRFKMAVNLSPRQFAQKDLLDVVQRTLHTSGLHPEDLELEITEQMLMVNTESTLETLRAIRELGVRIAIDDFGTGFSSFSYILQYQVDRIKIDRSFISKATVDQNAMAVTRAIIRMARGLKMRVVAEGVETLEQFEFLTRQKCDIVQGFYFAFPVPKEKALATLESIRAKVPTHSKRRGIAQVMPRLTQPRAAA